MMNRYDPFASFFPVSDLVGELLDRSVVRPSAAMTFPFDLYATDEDLWLRAAIPGADAASISLTANQQTLTVQGQRAFPQQEQAQQAVWYARGLYAGEFQFTVGLPFPVNAEQAEASYENGILTIRLPKAEWARVKRIAVSSGGSAQPQIAAQSKQTH